MTGGQWRWSGVVVGTVRLESGQCSGEWRVESGEWRVESAVERGGCSTGCVSPIGRLLHGLHLPARVAQTVSRSERGPEIRGEEAALEGLRRGGGGRQCWCIGQEQLDQQR
jgi:hypothetical protein